MDKVVLELDIDWASLSKLIGAQSYEIIWTEFDFVIPKEIDKIILSVSLLSYLFNMRLWV